MFSNIVVFVLAIWLPGLKTQEYSICEVDDIPCMREHFATHSSCDPRVFGKMPPSITAQDIRFQVPFFNMSHNDQQSTAKNLDQCVVKIFSRNEETRTTIFGIECLNVRIEVGSRAFIPHTVGRPNKVYFGRVVAEYDIIRLTIIFHGDVLDACRETCHAWTTLPTLFVQGQDSESVKYLRDDPRGIFGKYELIWIREIWAHRAQALCEAWLRNMMCDFNCHYKKYL